jgi:hypothetical protein
VDWSVSCRFCSQKFNLSIFDRYCWPCRAFGTISCRLCSQKFNLLVFLVGIADHAGSLVVMHGTEWWKESKKAKSHTQAQNKSQCKTEVFYGPFLPIWYCINLSFWYLYAVCSAAMAVLFMWIPCGIPYVKTTRWHTWHQEGCCK